MKLSFLLSTLFLIQYSNAQTFNRDVPSNLFEYEYVDQGFNGIDYFLATPFKISVLPINPNYVNPYPIITDSKGYIAWYAQPNVGNIADFKYHPSIKKYSYFAYFNAGVSFIILDSNLNRIDTLNTLLVEEDAHDIQLAQNGNWLLASKFYDTADLSTYIFNGSQGDTATVIRGFGVQEFDQNGNLVFEWNSNNHISPTETYDFYGYNANDFDYCHGNAIHEDIDGHLLFSFRHMNAVYKVNRTTGSVIWRLGGKSSSFTFLNDSGFSGQHDIRRILNGNYTLYDNSNMGPTPKTSRGVEYVLDTINWTATKTNEFIHPTATYHRAMGSFSTTADNYRVLGYGFSFSPNIDASVFDSNHNVLCDFIFEDSVMSYRFHYMPLPKLIQPEITCTPVTGGFELTAPIANSYEWSTGDTTQTIILSNTGTYQVWIPYGEGFIGSKPFFVTNTSNPCGYTAIEKVDKNLPIGDYTLYDLLGKKVNHLKNNELYIQVFKTGLVRKIVFKSLY